jgi:hypothetical protein
MSFINEALEILRARGHDVQTNPGACVVDGEMLVPIDGKLRNTRAIHEMVTPPDEDVFGFEACEKQFELHIRYFYGGAIYKMYQDGKEWGIPQRASESPSDLARRIVDSMDGHSLRRL